jgi:hypothetical protein
MQWLNGGLHSGHWISVRQEMFAGVWVKSRTWRACPSLAYSVSLFGRQIEAPPPQMR